MIVKGIDFLRNNVKLVKNISFLFLIAAVVFDLLVSRHPHFWGDNFRGFWALFGLLGSVVMIKICKGISHLWLMREEDYYDE